MDELRKIISDSYFTHPIMLLSALLLLFLGLYTEDKFHEVNLIVLYPLASLIQGCLAYYSFMPNWNTMKWHTDFISESLFILIEFIIIYKFFQKVIVLKNLKIYIRIIFIIYIIYLLSMWVFTDAFYKYPFKVFLLESLCILFFCFLYLFQLF